MALTGYQPRFLRQPSGLVRMNTRHWLAKDIVFAHTGLQAFVAGAPVAPALETAGAIQSASADVVHPLQNAAGWTVDGSVYSRYAIGGLLGLPLTLMAWSRPSNNSAVCPVLCLRAGTTTEAVELESSTTELPNARSRMSTGSSNAAAATGTPTASAWQHGAAVFVSAASRAAYFNAGGAGSSATSRLVNPVLDTVEVLRNAANTVAASTLSGVALPIIVSRALSAAEIEQFYREQLSNPWAIFAQQPIWVPVAAAGGGSAVGSFSAAWAVRNAASGSSDSAWSVRNAINTGSVSSAWSVLGAVGSSFAAAWSVRNSGAGSTAGAWSVQNQAAGSYAGAWSVDTGSSAFGSFGGAWSVQNAAAGSAAGAWSLRNAAAGSTTGEWSVLNRAAGSYAGVWSVLSSGAEEAPVTPASRRLSIPKEDRVLVLSAETRQLSIPRESRSIAIGPP